MADVWILLLASVLPDAIVLQPYQPAPLRVASSIRCSLAAPVVRLVEGALPAGLTLDGSGQFHGTPAKAGEYPFTVESTGGCLKERQKLVLRVTPAPILLAETATTEYETVQGAPMFAAASIRITVSKSGLAYQVDAHKAPWLHWRQRFGQNADQNSDIVTLEIDPAELGVGVYTARVQFSAWQAATAPEVTLRLRVKPAASALPTFRMEAISMPEPLLLTPPNVSDIHPPVARWPRAPQFRLAPKRPVSIPSAEPSGGPPQYNGPGRSRVMPFKKVPLSGDKPADKTKPSAMPVKKDTACACPAPAPVKTAAAKPAAH